MKSKPVFFFSKSIYLFTFFLLFVCFHSTAQTPSAADSLSKAKQDSINKSQAAAAPAAPAEAPKTKKDTRPIGQRLGFNIASSFWVNTTSVYFEISPLLTYYFPKTYSIGAGPTYVLNHDRRSDISYDGWGGKVYGQADFTRWLYGWVEYQGINNEYLTGYDESSKSFTKGHEYVNACYLSMGINLHLGRLHFNFQALYDVLYDKDHAYTPEPWSYRVGFGF